MYNSLESGIVVASQRPSEDIPEMLGVDTGDVNEIDDDESPLISQLQINVTEMTPKNDQIGGA